MEEEISAAGVNEILKDAEELKSHVLSNSYVEYEWKDCRILRDYSDSFWRMLGYKSRESFQSDTDGHVILCIDRVEGLRVRGEIEKAAKNSPDGFYQVVFFAKDHCGQNHEFVECGHVENDNGTTIYRAQILDVTPIYKMREAMTHRLTTDDVTGLPNMDRFYQAVRSLISQHPDVPFEIMTMDIDRFRVINDLFGMETGNRLLRFFGSFFANVNLAMSVFGHIHADKFVMCYPSNETNRARFVQSLQRLAESFPLDYRIMVRFGVYCVRDTEQPVSVMCDRASLALRKAKSTKDDVCCEYDEGVRQRLLDEQIIINTMENALHNNEYVVLYQPKFDLKTERVVGAEALVRWQHPTEGFVPPGRFIPVFENTGFIYKLDQYVWEKTCQFLRDERDKGYTPPPISVNVSRIDLYHRDIIHVLASLVTKYDIPTRLLELEITESAYMDNPEQMISLVSKLHEEGFTILMDDFGSGYSSLNMLRDLPVDLLKLDLRFLENGGSDGRGGSIISSIVGMSEQLNMPVIAEGVETRTQADFLRTIKCDYGQGFYFSRPVSEEKYRQMLMADRTGSKTV